MPNCGLALIQVRVTDAAQLQAAMAALQSLADPVSRSLLGPTIREATVTSADDGLITVGITDQGIAYRLSEALDQSIDIVRRRVDQSGNADPLIQRQGLDRLIVQVPGITDPQRLKTLLNQPAKLSFHMLDNSMPVQTAINGQPPVGSEVLYSQDDPPDSYLVQTRPVATGDSIIDAQQIIDAQTSQQVVTFRLDDKATQAFAQATAKNVGQPYVVVLDDQVISVPLIKQPITDGDGRNRRQFLG